MTSMTADGSVEFRFYRAEASEVLVAGDFTRWQSGAIPMRRDANGWWVLSLELPAGEHHFRYLADGVWYTDFAANGVEFAKKTWNSVLVVPEAAASRIEQEQERWAA